MSRKILVIDDEPQARTLIRDTLADAGYEVLEARDGQEGEQMLSNQKPDLVCLDILLSEETGVKLFHDMRKNEALKDIPVVILDDTTDEQEGAGRYLEFQRFLEKQHSVRQPEGYVKKPFNGEDILAQVNGIFA